MNKAIHILLLVVVSLVSAFECSLFEVLAARFSSAYRQENTTTKANSNSFSTSEDLHLPKNWSVCGSSNGTLKIHQLSFTPDPPQRGQPIQIHFEGLLESPITDPSTLHIVVYYGPIKLYDRELNLCTELAKVKDLPHCPIPEGTLIIDHTEMIPKDVPPGRYIVEASGDIKGEEDRSLFCLTGELYFPPNSVSPSSSRSSKGSMDSDNIGNQFY